MSIELRHAIGPDRQAVEQVVEAAYGPYVSRMGRKPGPMLDDYGALIGAGRVHVAVRDDEVVGLLVLVPESDVMLLDNVAVLPALHGTGLGRRLLAFAEDQARDAGCSTIRLYTHETMTENIGLYARIGYHETQRAEDQGLRRVYMRKAL